MARWIPQDLQDYILNDIAACDGQVMTTQQPGTYFNAVRPPLWLQSHVYIAGDIVHPPTENEKVYECTVGGTSGSSEPAWGTVQDATFSDGTVTWKVHNNYSLASRTLVSGDKEISDDVGTGGRKLVIAEKMGVVSHAAGIVSHVALINSVTKALRYVSTAQTTLGSNEIESGRTTIFYALTIIVADPVA